MKIWVFDDKEKLLGIYKDGFWDGPMDAIPKIVHLLCVAMNDYPRRAFQKAVNKLPEEHPHGT